MKIPRYELSIGYDKYYADTDDPPSVIDEEASPDGDWCKWEDVEQALLEIRAGLAKALERQADRTVFHPSQPSTASHGVMYSDLDGLPLKMKES